jgi:hypothetical protein
MSDRTPGKTPAAEAKKTVQSREDRLKAALKANLARRKAQARKRAGTEADQTRGSED